MNQPELPEPWDRYSHEQPPRGLRHPIIQSELRSALIARDVRLGHVGLWLASDPPDEVAGIYWHTDSDSGYRKSNKWPQYDNHTLLVVNAVPSAERAAIHDALVGDQLGELIDWAGTAQRAGNAWQASRHFLRLRWRDGFLHRDEL